MIGDIFRISVFVQCSVCIHIQIRLRYPNQTTRYWPSYARNIVQLFGMCAVFVFVCTTCVFLGITRRRRRRTILDVFTHEYHYYWRCFDSNRAARCVLSHILRRFPYDVVRMRDTNLSAFSWRKPDQLNRERLDRHSVRRLRYSRRSARTSFEK